MSDFYTYTKAWAVCQNGMEITIAKGGRLMPSVEVAADFDTFLEAKQYALTRLKGDLSEIKGNIDAIQSLRKKHLE